MVLPHLEWQLYLKVNVWRDLCHCYSGVINNNETAETILRTHTNQNALFEFDGWQIAQFY